MCFVSVEPAPRWADSVYKNYEILNIFIKYKHAIIHKVKNNNTKGDLNTGKVTLY